VVPQHAEFKDLMAASWRISGKGPADLKKDPEVPKDTKWTISR